jgi:hypothetical protein
MTDMYPTPRCHESALAVTNVTESEEKALPSPRPVTPAFPRPPERPAAPTETPCLPPLTTIDAPFDARMLRAPDVM